jgi:hypothetical protein
MTRTALSGTRLAAALKPNPRSAGTRSMIEEFALEALAAVALGWGALAVFRSRPASPSLGSWVAQLRRRHRREARAIVALAREQDTRHAAGSLEAFTARETLRSYLPETLAAYLAVPPAQRRVRCGGNLSPDEELSRQLRTLRHGLERAERSDADAAAARMAANGAFLRERFGRPPARDDIAAADVVEEIGAAIGTLHTYLRRI